MTNNNNPWAGLASYEDPSKSERKLKFCGRDNDIYDVTRLIDDNLLLILYGKSGIGKTSLLNAGVFPKLRLEQYLPVSIRLGTLEAEASYQDAIVSAVEKTIEEIHGSVSVFDVVEEQTDNQQPDRLWNYFARNRFANAERQPLFPVVVLDQFEEVLRNTSPEHVVKAQTLLNQLQYLIDESHALSDCVVDGQEYFYDFNFRFVISIREDELYLLEDNIDDLSLSMFRNCRYRLRSLSEQGAKEAILIPGKDYIAEEEKQAVVDRIIKLSKRPQSNDIDTFLLSLVCAGTYDKKVAGKIMLSDLAVWKSNPMEVYYQDAIKGLSANQVRYIQQHLIREDGSRKRVDANEAKAALGESTYHILTKGENRMLVLGEHEQAELLHDQLALAVYEERKAFEERERKKRLRRRVLVIGWLILIVFGAFWWQNKNIKKQNQLISEINQDIQQKNSKLLNDSIIMAAQMDSINKRDILIVLQQASLETTNNNLENANAQLTIERNNLKATNWKMMEGLSRIVAENANKLVDEGDSYTSQRLLLEVLPMDLEKPNKPYTKEVESSFRNAIMNNDAVLKGHTSYVKSISSCPNGKRIVSSGDKTIRIWDVLSGELIRTIEHSTYVNSATFSPNGKHIASASADNIVRVWDAESGLLIQCLKGHSSSVYSVDFSPDGKFLVSASYDNTLRIWCLNTSKLLKTIFFPSNQVVDQVLFARFSPDGKRIVSASNDKTVRVWHTETGELIYALNGHTDRVNSVTFSPDGLFIASASSDKTVRIWDAETGKEIKKLEYTSSVNSVTFSPDDNYFVSAEDDGSITVFSFNEDSYVLSLIGHTDKVNSVAYIPNGKQIVSASSDGTVRIWDNPLKTDVNSLIGHSAKYSPDGDFIAFVSRDNTIKIWNSKTNNVQKTLKGHTDKVNSITFSPEGKRIASASYDGTIRIWDVETGNTLQTMVEPFSIKTVAFSPNGKLIASASSLVPSKNNVLLIRDCESGIIQKSLEGHFDDINSVVFSPNGKYIASASNDKTIKIWDAITGENVHTLKGHTGWVYSAVYSPNGKRIASASRDKTIKIWCSETGNLQRSLEGHLDKVNSISFSPDGKRIVSSSDDKSVKVWDVENGDLIYTFRENAYSANLVSFSPDGKRIISSSKEGIIRILDFPPLQELIDQTRERFKNRPLTDEERRMYYLE